MKNVIDIDGSKLKSLLTEKTGKSLKELSLENGFSDSFLRMVIKSGKASPTAQAVIKLYGIEPSEYELKPETAAELETDAKQLSFDDFNSYSREELKEVVKEAFLELLYEIEVRAFNDPITQSLKIAIREKEKNERWTI